MVTAQDLRAATPEVAAARPPAAPPVPERGPVSPTPGKPATPLPGVPEEDGEAHRVRMVVAWRRSVRRDVGSGPVRLRLRLGANALGSAFLGALVAAGLTWLLITVVAGLSVVLGLGPEATRSAQAAGDSGAAEAMTRSALVGSVLVAHAAGGHAAARMSPPGGAAIGVVVWLWMQLLALVVVSLGAVTDAAGGLPDASTGGAGERLVDWNLGAVGSLMLLAVASAALIGSTCGSVLPVRRSSGGAPGRLYQPTDFPVAPRRACDPP